MKVLTLQNLAVLVCSPVPSSSPQTCTSNGSSIFNLCVFFVVVEMFANVLKPANFKANRIFVRDCVEYRKISKTNPFRDGLFFEIMDPSCFTGRGGGGGGF